MWVEISFGNNKTYKYGRKKDTILGADCTLSNDIDLSHIKCVADTARNI